ncbi:MAG: thiamine pyrophosphate-binding protein [Gemmatimonadota bacterium]
MTTLTGGQIAVQALEDEAIPFAFGIPGTHNIELYDALATSPSVRAVLITDEQSAGFMADAVWRASGRLACVNLVPGAGVTHAMSGIAEAYMDNVPLLVLGCGIRRDTGMGYQLHDVDQMAMVAPVTKGQFRPERGEEIYDTIRRACRLAREGTPGPVFVEIPANLYLFKHPVPRRSAPVEARRDASGAALAALDSRLAAAAALLNAARRPLIYVGLGAQGAREAIIALAERLEAPVSTTFQGKGVVPESHPLLLWPGFGDAAPPFARRIAAECDVTLAIGCRFGEVATGSYGLRPPGALIHLDIAPEVIGRNYRAEVGLVGDAAWLVPRLLERLVQKPRDPVMRARIAEGREAVREERLARVPGDRVIPAHLLASIQHRFGPHTIFTSDSGNGTFIAVECLSLDRPGQLLAPVDYSCMGYSVPAAIGAKLARPESPVVALVGDGAFLMTGMELLTAAQQSLGVACFVLRDRELAQIAQFQGVALNRKTCSVLPDYDLAPLCQGLGVECLRLERDAEVPAIVEQARELTGRGQPVVIDTAIDYSEKTWFTRGVVKTNLARLPWPERVRFVWRAVTRRL